MKQLRLLNLILLAGSFSLCFSHQIMAQAGSTKPELIMLRHNSGPGGAQPVLQDDLIGALKWNALTEIKAIRTGASIHSFVTKVTPGFLEANMIFQTSGSTGLLDRMIITQEGRVGIGTNTPSSTPDRDFRLHTEGNTYTSGDFFGRIHFDPNTGTNDAPNTYIDEAYFELKNRTVLTSPAAAAPGMTMPSGANAQGGLLSLAPGGSSLDHQLFFGDDGIFSRRMAGNAGGWTGAGAGWYKLLSSENINGTAGQLARFTGTIGDPSSSLGDSRIFDNGIRIGIGTNTPAAGFDVTIGGNSQVAGNANVTGNLDVNGNTGLGTAPTANRLEVLGNSQLNGNLGIGKAPTSFDLDVAGESNFDGRVKIGANSFPTFAGAATYELAVGGGIIAEEVLVRLQPWADYVFDQNYNLMPLQEVAQFTRQNQHLPGVPAANEIAEKGLNLGVMQNIQMEKIEEIYLHLIAMEKRVNQLEIENAALKAQLIQLETRN